MCFHLSLYEALKSHYFNLFFMLMKRARVVVSIRNGGDLKCVQRLSLQMVVGFGP